ncbi:DUF6541 family protein [Amycolatopsis nigrescens]|uniref:DUF6541 family protein n=1 Tax=Amycolatopsis nigrescens TaxID=381445 RepID=UPI00036B4F10|nr:DUF6541 family protein [Amycolatopsis nigrescens]
MAGVLLLVAVFGFLWLPGMALAAALRRSGWAVLGAAPAVTFGLAGLAGPLFSLLGVPWRPWTYLTFVLAVVAVVLVVRLSRPRAGPPHAEPDSWHPGGFRWIGTAVLVAAAAGAAALVLGMRGLDAVSQIWDMSFHGNAIRYITETGDPDPAALAAIVDPQYPQGFFYPNGFHLLGSLVQSATGRPPPEVLNGMVVAVATLLVPLSTAGLAAGLGARAAVVAASVAVSTTFTNFPYQLWSYGGLYPYTLALCLVGPALALVVRWLKTGDLATLVLAVSAASGVLVVHPSAAFVLAVFLALVLLLRDRGAFPLHWPRFAALAGLSLALLLPTLAGLLRVTPKVAGFQPFWAASSDGWTALGRLFTLGGVVPQPGEATAPPQWVLAVLVFGGLALLLRDRAWRWVAVAMLVFGALYVLSVATDHPVTRMLAAPWWNDSFRLVAVLPMVGAVAAGFALDAVRRRFGGWQPALVLLAGYLGATGGYVATNAERVRGVYQPGPVTGDVLAGMRRLEELVPPGTGVMNDNGDGSTWTYGLVGRPTVVPYFGNFPAGSDRAVLLARFDELATDDAVRELVRKYNIGYAVVAAPMLYGKERVPGLRELDGPAFRLVYANPGFRIYRLS